MTICDHCGSPEGIKRVLVEMYAMGSGEVPMEKSQALASPEYELCVTCQAKIKQEITDALGAKRKVTA